MTSKLWAACTAVVLGLGLGITGGSAAFAVQDTCPDAGEWHKSGDINTISTTATAPPDTLIVEVCYKSSTTVVFYDVNPPAGSVTITSTVTNENNEVQEISHYSIRVVDIPDECPDVTGIQTTNTECPPDPCPDVAGIQTNTDECEVDECPDVAGVQSNTDECETDECPDVAGVQSNTDECETDECPDVAGVQTSKNDCEQEDKKVWVCKFVASENSPGGYRLKEGKQPIHVSENALDDDVNDTGTFKDAQPSFVVPRDDATLCSHTTVVVVEQVVCPATGVAGIVNITTTTTLFYGSTQIGDPVVVHTTRALTPAELAACPKVIIVINPEEPTLPVTNGVENASLIVGAGLLLMLAGGSMFWVTRRNSKFE